MLSRALWLAMLCATAAHASPRSDPTAGRAVFTGATTPSATSIDVNPAALGRSVTNELFIGALATLNRYAIDRRTLDIDTGALGAGDSVTDTLISPGGMVGVIWHPGGTTRVTLGAALRSSPAEQFLEGHEALRYHTLGGSFRTVPVPIPTVAASLRLSSRFYVGVSLGSQSSILKLKYARDTALDAARDPARGIDSDCGGAPCGVENPLAEERYTVDVASDRLSLETVAANLGVLVRLWREVYIGIGYHLPPGLAIQNALTGDVIIERAPRDGGGTIKGAATVYVSQPASVDAELSARPGLDLELHVGVRWEHLSRMQSFDVRSYGSTLPPAGIPEWQLRTRGFDSVWSAWAGVEQVERDFPLILGGRIGFETAALEDRKTSPLNVAPTSLTLDAGLQYRITTDPFADYKFRVQLTYGLQYFPTVDVTDSAYDPRTRLACADAGYDYSLPACESVRFGYAQPTAAGEYSRIEQAARIAVRMSW